MLADRVRIGRKKGQYIGKVYLAQDADFVKVSGVWVYRGSELQIEIPHIIQGEEVTSYENMFRGTTWPPYNATPVTRVDSNNKKVTNMRYMFAYQKSTSLNLSNFNTSKVTDMDFMFFYSKPTSLNLSNFNTSNVTRMSSMFERTEATSLDLSSFDTSNDPGMRDMFLSSKATTGYARTQADADRFNDSDTRRPAALVFVVKP